MADYFRVSRNMPAEDEALLQHWLSQWVVEDLSTIEEFEADLGEAGFESIDNDDVTPNITPSSARMRRTGMITGPLAVLFRMVGLHTKVSHGNWKSSMLQYDALERGTWRYRIVHATKP